MLKAHAPVALAALTLAALFAGGCGGSGGGSRPDPRVRAINLSPDATLDVRVDDGTKTTNLAYLATDAPSFTLSPGTYDFGLRETGSTVDLVAEGYDLAADGAYVYAAVGLKNFADENSKRLRGVLVGYPRTSPGESKARIVAINAGIAPTGSETPAVRFRSPGETPATNIGPVDLGGATTTVLDAGVQTIEVRAEGADAVLASATPSLLPGRTYVLAFTGTVGATGDAAPTVRFLLLPEN